MPADDITPALDELRCAQPQYERAENYYEGNVDEVFLNPVIRRMMHGNAIDFRVNLACRPVNVVLDRLEIAAIVGDTDEVTRLLNEQVWHANQLDLETPELHRNALMYGDAYMFAWDGRGFEPLLSDGPASVSMFYKSPLTSRVFYDESNPRLISLAIDVWEDRRGVTKIDLYYPDSVERYEQGDKDKAKKGKFDLIAEYENPYGEVPFYHFRTRAPYGKAEHYNAYGPQDALNKLIINQMSASDFAAFPQRYGILESGGTSNFADSLVNDDDDPETANTNLKSSPGGIWTLQYLKEVGQFASADVSNFLDPMDKYVHLMSTTTATPMSYLDPTGNIPSGEAQRQADAPLVAKVQYRQRSFGATWNDLLAFSLNKILGIQGRAIVRWAPAQVLNDLTGWQTIQLKKEAGVPLRQCFLEAGYDEVLVSSWGYTPENPNGNVTPAPAPGGAQ